MLRIINLVSVYLINVNLFEISGSDYCYFTGVVPLLSLVPVYIKHGLIIIKDELNLKLHIPAMVCNTYSLISFVLLSLLSHLLVYPSTSLPPDSLIIWVSTTCFSFLSPELAARNIGTHVYQEETFRCRAYLFYFYPPLSGRCYFFFTVVSSFSTQVIIERGFF